MVIKPNDEIEEVDGVLSRLKCTYYYNPGGADIPSYKMLIDALFCDSIPQHGKPDTWPVHDLPLHKKCARIDPDSVGGKLCIPGVLVECEFKREEPARDEWQHVPTDNSAEVEALHWRKTLEDAERAKAGQIATPHMADDAPPEGSEVIKLLRRIAANTGHGPVWAG